jgi:hypothetical protein
MTECSAEGIGSVGVNIFNQVVSEDFNGKVTSELRSS